MNIPHRSGTHRAVESLDGTWSCATDPNNVGTAERWFRAVPEDARPAPVPGTIQQVFAGYHGIAWYWCQMIPARNPHPQGRYLLRFGAVDYRAEVWVNAERISTHDGAETPFVLDITDSVRPGERNLLSVRVLNPTDELIDGIALSQIPHRNKSEQATAGSALNHGGIVGSVELLCRPAIYISELVAKPDPKSGVLSILALVLNTLETVVPANIKFSVAAASGGETLQAGNTSRPLQPGQTLFETQLPLSAPRLWEPDDPYLYRLTARLLPDAGGRGDATSTHFGFRDFRLTDGHFRLNGRRFFWKCARTLNNFPIGQAVPSDANVYRRELILLKSLGFNSIRFMAGLPAAVQLDLCDELGLLVYEENHAAWKMSASPVMGEQFDRSLREMILRDRNHPSVVIWGLLTDTPGGPVFDHAVQALPAASFLDDTRLIFLNSGRSDGRVNIGSFSNPGSAEWETELPAEDETDQQAGDIHLAGAEPAHIRTLGAEQNAPVFISDWRLRGAVDLLRACRSFEQAGREGVDDARMVTATLDQFFRDWDAWGMADVFCRPEDFFSAISLRADQRRQECLTAMRSNPHVIGLTVGLSDDGATGIGVLNSFREPRPGSHALADALAPLRWCLSADPSFVARGDRVKIGAALANADALNAGIYPLLIQLFDPANAIIFERRAIVEIAAGVEKPLALPIASEELALNGLPGRYRLTAAFEQGAAAPGDTLEFLVAAPPPAPTAEVQITLWTEDPTLSAWLSQRGIAFTLANAHRSATAGEIILAVAPSKRSTVSDSFGALAERAEAGATVIFLTPDFFRAPNNGGWLPAGEIAAITSLRQKHEPIDAWGIAHSVFDGLSAAGLLEDRAFRDLLPVAAFIDVDAGAQILAAAHLCRVHPDEYRSGVALAIHEHGAGRIVLNSFRILEHLGADAAADHLMLNLLRQM
jgi:hypothetical protein